ncbi:hypothetical protein [Mycobacterium sp. E1214]|uniref:hypothetical protein n=1 Tax=Mycobacterium sp. E1214 TaxID=1834123 RepID=UPI001E365334|nr:hypothetical protein [Mycobacterium sp. E1214]
MKERQCCQRSVQADGDDALPAPQRRARPMAGSDEAHQRHREQQSRHEIADDGRYRRGGTVIGYPDRLGDSLGGKEYRDCGEQADSPPPRQAAHPPNDAKPDQHCGDAHGRFETELCPLRHRGPPQAERIERCRNDDHSRQRAAEAAAQKRQRAPSSPR